MGSNLEMMSVSSKERESEKDRSERRRQQKKRGYYRKTLSRIERVQGCEDIVWDWGEDPGSLEWWKSAFDVLEPPPASTISQWADTTRMIPGEFAAEPGEWRTDKIECMRAVMDACSPNDPCNRVVLVKSSQTSGTESAILNTIGFTIDVNPRSMLVVFPTLDLAESFAKERLEPMIDICPTLKNKVHDLGRATKKEGSASTIKKKRYPGGFLNMVGANSTSGLSSRPVPIVLMDEVDRCIQNAGREGNPTKLLSVRATTFPDRKEIFISSPVKPKEESGILQMYEASTQEEWELQCLECDTWQVLEWEEMDVDTCKCKCINCKRDFEQWEWLTSAGRWVAKNPGYAGTRGFRVNGLISPWLTWEELCIEYKEAKKLEEFGDNSLMKVFVNTRLAKAYEQEGKRIEIDLFNTRREVYECHRRGIEIPDGVILLTAGIDVQDSMLAYEVIGWGRGKESWGIEAGEFQGDPRNVDGRVWQLLDEFVYSRIWHYSDGAKTRVRCMFVDSGGHCTTEVYKYTKQRHPRAFAIKGADGIGVALILGAKRREASEGAWIVRVGSDTLKEELHARLRIEKPGPGYCHFPMLANGMPTQGYDRGFFDQLLSEKRILRYNKSGFAEYEWTKARTEANEALDCRNYARAALEYLKVKLEQMSRDTLMNIPESDIHIVEVGTGKRITVNQALIEKQRINRKGTERNRYGINRQSVSTIDESRQPETQGYQGASGSGSGAAPRRSRFGAQTGAGGSSF